MNAMSVPDGFWQRDVSHCPRPLSPLMRSASLPLVTAGARRMFTELGALPTVLEWREIDGWVYIGLIGPGEDAAQRIATSIRAIDDDRAGAMLRRWHAEWRPRLRARAAELRAAEPHTFDDAERIAHYRSTVEHLADALGVHFLIHGAGALILAELAFTCHDLFGWDDNTTLALLAGLSPASTELADGLAELAAARQGPEQAAAFDGFQRRFGMRTLDYELTGPTLGEDPHLVWRLVEQRRTTGYEPAAAAAAGAATRAAARIRAARKLDGRTPVDRERFAHVLERAERYYPLREDDGPLTWNEPLALVRRAALAIGERLCDRGVLDSAADVVMLEDDEVRAALMQPIALQDRVDRRRTRLAEVAADPAPATYGIDPGPPDLRSLPPQAQFVNQALGWLVDRMFALQSVGHDTTAGTVLCGLPASAGTYTGRVRIIRTVADFNRLRRGDVLVASTTAPPWAVLFPLAGALVTDVGGVLSHPAITAREFGLPAVVATGTATQRLRDDQIVTVDGDRGQVIPR
jgi:phosphohistidine swiveling domain-containing protein